MKKVVARQVDSIFSFPRGSEIDQINLSNGDLTIRVSGTSGESSCIVTFHNQLGFRVLDELYLMEYWPICSTPCGWFFQIVEGGWLEQERIRSGSCLMDMYPDVKEFLIAGINDCVSVLSIEAPTLSDC